MCNSIFIDKDTLPSAKDGEEFHVKIKGVYRTEDGVRKLDVLEVDGNEVGDPSDCGCGEDPKDLIEQDSEDALRIFFIKGKKGQ